MRKTFFAFAIFLFGLSSIMMGQNPTLGQSFQKDYNVIQTPVPFLNIAPDARSSAMGDLGAATTPDLNSLHWNAAKYAFLEDKYGIATTYTPWLRGLTNDIKLLYLTGFVKLDKQQALAFGIRYFTLGSVQFTDDYGEFVSKQNPNEFTLEGTYSRLFSDKISGGITFRYILSDLAKGSTTSGQSVSAGMSVAADISTYYHTPVRLGSNDGEWAMGINISNIGSKISYTDGDVKSFIPTNLRIGTRLSYDIDQYNTFSFGVDLNKLLVPTPPIYSDSDRTTISKGMDPDVSVAQGIFQSFYDAPGGMSEELKEVMLSIGAEYWYQKQFALRAGYFNEAAMKGNRKYMTVGVGLKLTTITIDFAYLIPNGGRSNPLANTMRISASFDIGQPKKTKK
ncbi:MAG TPA: type IX secretion system outer membrane channel protein PorV [Bacteroidales bacterium]